MRRDTPHPDVANATPGANSVAQCHLKCAAVGGCTVFTVKGSSCYTYSRCPGSVLILED